MVVGEQDPFCIAYTSGTTGRPKGVVISHRSRALTFYMSALEWGLGTGRVSAAIAPMYHGAGFAFGFAPVFTGGTVTMLRAWDPEEMLALVERDRVQSAFLVPTHAQMIRALGNAALDRHDLSSLDTLYFNAAALPWALKEWVMEQFPACGVHELYGSTEGGIVTNLRPADQRRKPGSVGHPWYLTEIRVVDEAGQPVGPGEPGELFSRSPYLMNGYHDDPEATAACTTEDGFLTCGDIVTLRRRGLRLDRGPQEGPDHLRRRQRLPARDRGGPGRAPGGGRGRRHRRPDRPRGARPSLRTSCSGRAPPRSRRRSRLTAGPRSRATRSPAAGRATSLPRNAAGKVLKRDCCVRPVVGPIIS